MPLSHLVALGLLQGFTEFLPISSSAHLILLPRLLDWKDQGLALDVAAHVGTLLAVCLYFRQDLARLGRAWLDSLARRGGEREARLAWGVLVATVPAALAGLLLHDVVETTLRSTSVIAAATIGFGLLLGAADHRGRDRGRPLETIGWREVLLIGLAQALALVPGTSRSGITITAGLFLGLSREASARFSFLLSIPIIALAGGYQGLTLLREGMDAPWGDTLLIVLLSAASAYLCIHLFLALIARMSLLPFVLYRLALGGVLLAL
ncbi:MAG: undecaprenyl-diphosphate phosphatase [Gammaproteobacteria bacterium]|nr:MAG: undecaprenyl-diphosphate phosphatase [Gammaproteobacteria bacterium]